MYCLIGWFLKGSKGIWWLFAPTGYSERMILWGVSFLLQLSVQCTYENPPETVGFIMYNITAIYAHFHAGIQINDTSVIHGGHLCTACWTLEQMSDNSRRLHWVPVLSAKSWDLRTQWTQAHENDRRSLTNKTFPDFFVQSWTIQFQWPCAHHSAHCFLSLANRRGLRGGLLLF